MTKLINKFIGRYFLCFLLSALICYQKNWETAFGIAISVFFAGGVFKLLWGKEVE